MLTDSANRSTIKATIYVLQIPASASSAHHQHPHCLFWPILNKQEYSVSLLSAQRHQYLHVLDPGLLPV